MIPKSLHTVSVLVAVATELKKHAHSQFTAADLVDAAAVTLGYAEAADVYGLKAAAVRKLEKSAGKVAP